MVLKMKKNNNPKKSQIKKISTKSKNSNNISLIIIYTDYKSIV